MRYALLSTVAAAALSLSVAAVAQGTSGAGGASGGSGGSGGSASGGSAGSASGGAMGGGAATGSGSGAATSGGSAPAQGPSPSPGTAAPGAASGSASGGSASVNLTPEQRTQVTRSFTGASVRPVTGINFAVAVGTVIPETLELHEVPVEVVRVVPAYSGYRYLMVGNQIVIVEPKARRIVAVLERAG